MCGRYTVFTQTDDSHMLKFLAQAGFDERTAGSADASRIAPSDAAPILLSVSKRVVSRRGVWGFPSYNGGLIINARSETARSKVMFAEAVRSRRCVIPACGFYEWSRGGRKQKYLFTSPDDEIIYMAGIYTPHDGQRRYVIFTRAADDNMISVHDRMPVLLAGHEVRAYLEEGGEELLKRTPLPLIKNTA